MVESWLVYSSLKLQVVVGRFAQQAPAGTVALAAGRELAEIVDSVKLGKDNRVVAQYCCNQCFVGTG